jgi:small-conductance mechanosensitive channel
MKRAVSLLIFGAAWIFHLSALGQSSRNLQDILDDTVAYQQAITISEIVTYEQETQVFVTKIQTGIDERGDLENITIGYLELDSLIKLKSPVSKESLIAMGPIALQNQEGQWVGYNSQLTSWHDNLQSRSSWFETQQISIRNLKILWQTTQTSAAEGNAPAEVLERIRSLQRSIRQLEDLLKSSRNNILQTDVKIADLLVIVNNDLVVMKEVREESVRSIVIIESPPLWQIFSIEEQKQEQDEGQDEEKAQPSIKGKIDIIIANRSNTISTYFESNKFEFYIGLLSLIIFYLSTLYLKRKSVSWHEEYKSKRLKTPIKSHAELVLKDRLLSVSILLTLLLTAIILPNRPVVIVEFSLLLAIYPLIRVVNAFSPQKLKPLSNFTAILFFIGHVNNLFVELQPQNRITLLLLSMALGVVLVLAIRRNVLVEFSEGIAKSIVTLLVWLGFFSQVIAFISNLIGNVTLSNYLVYGFLNLFFISVLIYTVATIFINLSNILMRSPVFQRLYMVQKHEDQIIGQITNILVLSAILIWLYQFLRVFEIVESVINGILAFFTSPITIGSFEFSLGDIVIFFFVVWISIVLSNTIRFLLEEEIFPRAKTKRGTSATIITFVRVFIITLGFVLAIGASGFPLDQLTLLIGAFGVGIGFGLQNIFNNLVSGFIIATERPVEVGDTIEVGTLVGEVREIGIRSSVVRTFDGAEVIVPNGNLISNELINWTHSDQQRRLKIPIGVAYGSDVHKVIEILENIGKDENKILQHPESYVLFRGFGDSSLDFEFRCWTSSDDWYILESDLTIKVHDALKENSIEIPFPQRDLHLRSVDSEIIKHTQKNIPPAKKN